MGRTVPSYRQALEMEIASWKGFHRALRSRDAEAFVEMMNACRMHASSGGMATRPIITDAMFMSILLSQQRALAEMDRKLKQLENSFPKTEIADNQSTLMENITFKKQEP